MLLSLTIHEAAHALAAKVRGDDTAQRLGRLTLNPLAHVDWVGTVLLPLAGALSQLPVVGWAKPVPVDLGRMKNPRWDNLIVSVAGPASNLLLAFCSLVVLALPLALPPPVTTLVTTLVWVNVFLAIFNMLPLPPLDGAAVASVFLPAAVAQRYERAVAPYGLFILLALVASGGLGWLPHAAANVVIFLQEIVKTVSLPGS